MNARGHWNALAGRLGWTLLAFVGIGLGASALAFCGFYVARADAKLYNKASQIIIARDGNRSNITMVSDYQGEVKDFAMVVPVPTVLQKDQIRVLEPSVMQKLDAYSAPRLVEYFDEDPCRPTPVPAPTAAQSGAAQEKTTDARAAALGVTVEAQYSVGEYDIVILSATQSNGLETWLLENGYKIPTGARTALQPYIKAGMKFFVAKVNLENFDKTGFTNLRPLQMSFESQMFMLPLRLGMLNARGDQDLIVYALTRKGRVETTNYPTVQIPSNLEIPLFVKNEFGKFYSAMFDTAYKREGKRAVFIEYAWDTSWCDPCASTPPTPDELERAGAGWVSQRGSVFLTRLHVRYGRTNFKEDLFFRETPSNQNFQGRYVLRHPWKGEATCEAAKQYQAELPKQLEAQAQTLANLTGWKIEDIRRKAGIR
jgi:hypothetical protein